MQWAPITRRVLKSLPKLKGIVRYGVGVDNIDLDAARELRIGVANVPTYCLEEFSNHAMAMMLSLARRIPQDHSGIAHGGWGVGPFLPIPAFLDMTLGLVGFGAIARRVAKKAQAFGFRIMAADPYLDDLPLCPKRSRAGRHGNAVEVGRYPFAPLPARSRNHSSHPPGDDCNDEGRRADHQHRARRRYP